MKHLFHCKLFFFTARFFWGGEKFVPNLAVKQKKKKTDWCYPLRWLHCSWNRTHFQILVVNAGAFSSVGLQSPSCWLHLLWNAFECLWEIPSLHDVEPEESFRCTMSTLVLTIEWLSTSECSCGWLDGSLTYRTMNPKRSIVSWSTWANHAQVRSWRNFLQNKNCNSITGVPLSRALQSNNPTTQFAY